VGICCAIVVIFWPPCAREIAIVARGGGAEHRAESLIFRPMAAYSAARGAY